MAQLINKKNNKTLAQNIIIAHSLFSRMKGLMGKKDFPLSDTLWLLPCKGGIHTFFVKFPIDVVFVNRSLHITHIFKNITPWKIVYPSYLSFLIPKTYSVFEFKTPALSHCQIQQGDQLHVGD